MKNSVLKILSALLSNGLKKVTIAVSHGVFDWKVTNRKFNTNNKSAWNVQRKKIAVNNLLNTIFFYFNILFVCCEYRLIELFKRNIL